MKLPAIIFTVLITILGNVYGQVKIRLFANQKPDWAIFNVTAGEYEINVMRGKKLSVTADDLVFISKYHHQLVIKKNNTPGLIADSVIISGITDFDSFSMRINGNSSFRQYYSGDLKCKPDLETMVFINGCDEEKYIAGVVQAEGGTGKNIEYFKTQAVIARTYMYRYIDKHKHDGYNLCDNTHCQAFNGLPTDSILNKAAMDTKGLVILDRDSMLIISAFHSNCGGETSSAEDVWLTSQSYLKKVKDPYCSVSNNAVWEKNIPGNEWIDYLRNSGYAGQTGDLSVFRFLQESRVPEYKITSFSMPLRNIRSEMNLRSTFFSVIPVDNEIILTGRGYGHGVGLCQEGAMVMAMKGFNYKKIIDFYYSGVIIADIKHAVPAK